MTADWRCVARAIRRPGAAVAACLTVAFGCASGTTGDQATTVDTTAAGTVVVRNAVRDGGNVEWRLERLVRIGQVDGPAPFSFELIGDVALGPDELVYVADLRASEVRVFDLEGRHVRTFGREGAGPGEMGLPYALAFDSSGRLWIADERAVAYHLFTSDGRFVERLRRPIRWTLTRGMLRISDDGELYEFGAIAARVSGAVRLSVNGEITAVDTIPVPYVEPVAFRMPPTGGEQFLRRVPFAPVQVTDIGPDGAVWTGDGRTYRLVQVGTAADTLRIVELDAAHAPLSTSEQRAAEEAAAAAAREGFEVDRSLIPTSHPAFTGIIVAEDGHLWVQRPVAAASPSGTRGLVYDVFTPDGHYLGSMPAPELGSYPTPHITRQYIVGVTTDSLDVQYVEVHRIVGRDR